jgi:fatty-acid desaturase
VDCEGVRSRTSLVSQVAVLGEGWHNNHHAFPSSARHGLHRLAGGRLLVGDPRLEKLGLVWDVKRPTVQQMARRRVQSAASEA